MTAQPTPEIPREVLEAAVAAELRQRRADAIRRRAERKARETRQPDTGRYAAVSSGQHRRRQRPVSSPEDRKWVPGVLRHWRDMHRLSQREAQARIGYSPTSNSWRNWESGFVVPSYSTLLRIIAATGLGYLQAAPDRTGSADVAPELLLEATHARHTREVRARRARRRRVHGAIQKSPDS